MRAIANHRKNLFIPIYLASTGLPEKEYHGFKLTFARGLGGWIA